MTPYEKLREDGFDPTTYDPERHQKKDRKDVFIHPDDPNYVRNSASDCWRPYDPDKHDQAK